MAEILASLIGKEWSLSFTLANIMAGFRKSGAYPLNLGVIKDRQVAPSLTGNPFGSRESVTDVKKVLQVQRIVHLILLTLKYQISHLAKKLCFVKDTKKGIIYLTLRTDSGLL